MYAFVIFLNMKFCIKYWLIYTINNKRHMQTFWLRIISNMRKTLEEKVTKNYAIACKTLTMAPEKTYEGTVNLTYTNVILIVSKVT